MEGNFRINKYLTQVANCSRRQADELIREGRVKVNGLPAQLGQLIYPYDEIFLDGRKLDAPGKCVVLAWYKPVGVTCTERDSHAGKTISDVFSYPVRVTYAGRLDRDSEGLLILSNDGDLIHNMMSGSAGHEKEYVVRVDREITDEFVEGMSRGVYLKELRQTTRRCRVLKEGKYTFRIVLTQGLNRQIRRMCAAFGYQVKSLKRVRVVNILLRDLKPGQYRLIEGDELSELYAKTHVCL